MNKSQQEDTEHIIANQFKQGVSMLDLAMMFDMSYAAIQNAIRSVMVREGHYDDSRHS